jgi:hypothetical protein
MKSWEEYKSKFVSLKESAKNKWRTKTSSITSSSTDSSTTTAFVSALKWIGITTALSLTTYAAYRYIKRIKRDSEANNNKNHVLFKQHPLNSTVKLSNGDLVTVPYHIYDGNAMFIVGTADLRCVQQLLSTVNTANQLYEPVITMDNRAIVVIWLMDYSEANIGPHRELQISFLVTDKRVSQQIRIDTKNEFSFIQIMSHPEVKLFCHGLWLSTSIAKEYNEEILGHTANLAHCDMNGFISTSRDKNFRFIDRVTGQLILKGSSVNRYASIFQYLAMPYKLICGLGLINVAKLSMDPTITVQVINSSLTTAISFTQTTMQTARRFNNKLDYVRFEEANSCHSRAYAQMDFEGAYVQHMNNFKFVYLNPHNTGDNVIRLNL